MLLYRSTVAVIVFEEILRDVSVTGANGSFWICASQFGPHPAKVKVTGC